MNLKFTNKHVLITGGARGLGYEIARQFGDAEAMVSLIDYNETTLNEATKVLQQLGYKVNPFVVDVSDQEAVKNCVDICEAISPIDVLVNNAGICLVTPFLELTREEWLRTLDINLNGAFYVAQAVCRYMAKRKDGSVLNMSSKNGLDGEFGHAHYNASKAGLVLLTKTMAIELAHLNINVNAICPGYIRGPLNFEVDSDEFVEAFTDRYIPFNRTGLVTDVAPIFLFLAHEISRYITGQTFVIDGGQLAGQKAFDWLINKK
jgi:3-oxoacyl-[acyl-carrier protein] reductase